MSTNPYTFDLLCRNVFRLQKGDTQEGSSTTKQKQQEQTTTTTTTTSSNNDDPDSTTETLKSPRGATPTPTPTSPDTPRFATKLLLKRSKYPAQEYEEISDSLKIKLINNKKLTQFGIKLLYIADSDKQKFLIKPYSPAETDRFQKEYEQLWACRGHPNVVKVFGRLEFSREGVPSKGIVLERLKMTLQDLLTPSEKVTWIDRVAIAYFISNGMSHVHSKKIIHNDLKPSNILIGERNEVVITDFGSGHLMSNPNATKTKSVGTQYTENYWAPERKNNKGTHYRSDVFSVWSVPPTLDTEKVPPVGCEEHPSQGEFKILQNMCVDIDPAKRPNFSEIKDMLFGILCKATQA